MRPDKKDHWPLHREHRESGKRATGFHYHSGIELDDILGDDDQPLDELARSLGAQAGAGFLARRKEP